MHEDFFVSDDVVVLNGGQNSDFVKGILYLFF